MYEQALVRPKERNKWVLKQVLQEGFGIPPLKKKQKNTTNFTTKI